MTTGITGRGDGLQSIFGSLDALGDTQALAAAAIGEVDAHLSSTIAAGTDPKGNAWTPRKKDGGRPLKNARAHVDIRLAGSSIIVELTGHDIHHHYGSGDNPRRQIIPTEIDEKLGQACRRGAVTFVATTAAGKRGYGAIRAKGGKVTRK